MGRNEITQGCQVGSQWDTKFLEVKAKLKVLRSPRKCSPSGRKKTGLVWQVEHQERRGFQEAAGSSGLLGLTRWKQNTEYYVILLEYLFVLSSAVDSRKHWRISCTGLL